MAPGPPRAYERRGAVPRARPRACRRTDPAPWPASGSASSGVLIDWAIASFIARGLFGVPLPFSQPPASGGQGFVVLAVFGVMHLLLVGTVGFTIGHRIMGLQVRSLGGAAASCRSRPWPAPSCSASSSRRGLGPRRPGPARQGAQHRHRPHPLTSRSCTSAGVRSKGSSPGTALSQTCGRAAWRSGSLAAQGLPVHAGAHRVDAGRQGSAQAAERLEALVDESHLVLGDLRLEALDLARELAAAGPRSRRSRRASS